MFSNLFCKVMVGNKKYNLLISGSEDYGQITRVEKRKFIDYEYDHLFVHSVFRMDNNQPNFSENSCYTLVKLFQ